MRIVSLLWQSFPLCRQRTAVSDRIILRPPYTLTPFFCPGSMARRHAGLILDSDGRRISTTRLSRAPRCYRIGSIRFQGAAPSNCLSVRLRLNSTRRSYSGQAFASKILCLPLTSRCVVYEIATALLGSARPLPRRSNRLRAPRANNPLVFHPGLKFPLRLFFASTVPAAHSSRGN